MIITPLSIAANHPAYAGHFPGQPVLPGVLLLDAVLHVLGQAGGGSPVPWEINSAKFTSAVRPGESLTLHHEALTNGSVRFSIRTLDRSVANGVLVPVSMEQGRGQQS